MTGRRPWWLAMAAPLLAACVPPEGANTAVERPDEGVVAEVEFVIDGDTVDLLFDMDGEVVEERTRLIGIDAPESVSRQDPVQCFGPESSEALRGLLPVGSEVSVLRDTEARDRFGRLLVYLVRPDGLDVNAWMVEQGFADALFFEPNTTREAEFTRLASRARDDGRGLWGVCDGPDQPLDETG